jgi:DnaD/phage-associated family protein
VATRTVFAAWEQEARQSLSPTIAEVLGEMIDRFGEALILEAIREAVETRGPGQFNVKYVLRIAERWESNGGRGQAAGRERKSARDEGWGLYGAGVEKRTQY